MKNHFFKNLLIMLLFLLGIGALYGGGLLIVSPSGEMLGLPISLLAPSPFRTFLIPGIILFVILGLAPILTIFALIYKFENKWAQSLNVFKDMHWSWSFTIYISFALIIWIQVQMSLLNQTYWAYTLYIFWAILILLIALFPQVRSIYKNSRSDLHHPGNPLA